MEEKKLGKDINVRSKSCQHEGEFVKLLNKEMQSLKDSQLIHDIEEFASDIDMNETGIYTRILDLIHRLQEHNGNQVRMRCDMQRRFDDLQNLCIEQNAEIEKLKINLANEKKWGKIQAKQAEKETAREILSMFNDRNYITENDIKKTIAKRYDVEVDYEN